MSPASPVAVAPPHPGDPAAAPAQVRDLGVAQQRERRLLLGGRGEHVEQVPLRDHRDERVPDGEPRQVGDRRRARVEDDPRLLDRLPRQLGEAVPETQLVDQRHRRDVDGVAAEVPQEVAVLLQHGDLDPGPREHQPQHDPGGPAADDRARRPLLCHRDPPRSPSRPACPNRANRTTVRAHPPFGQYIGCRRSSATTTFLRHTDRRRPSGWRHAGRGGESWNRTPTSSPCT